MARRVLLWCLTWLAILDGAAACAGEPSWARDVRDLGLGQTEVEHLEASGIVMTGIEVKQVFQAYETPTLPVFITSDAVLAAYHVLFEESVCRLEAQSGGGLRSGLETLWRALLEGGPRFLPEGGADRTARQRAQVILATAVLLAGGVPEGADEQVLDLAQTEVRRVERARDVVKPRWLGPPDRSFLALDYSRFRPRGPYESSPNLARQFRVVGWLQAIPLRVDRPSELQTARLLISACNRMEETDREGLEHHVAAFDELLGSVDDLPVTTVARWFREEGPFERLGSFRSRVVRRARREDATPLVRDVLADARSGAPAADLTIRLLPGRRTADSAYFQRALEADGGYLPSGWHLADALGFVAPEGLHGPSLPGRFERSPMRLGAAVYDDELRCLELLMGPRDARAPMLFSSAGWRVKSLQTSLAAWALLRHTWVLQAKQTVVYMGISTDWRRPGFVEPNPTFWLALQRMVQRTRSLMEARGVVQPNAVVLRDRARLLRDRGEAIADRSLTEEERSELATLGYLARVISHRGSLADPAFRHDLAAAIERLADRIEVTGSTGDAQIDHALVACHVDIRPQWHDLELLCGELANLAERQLSTAPLRQEDERLFATFGDRLARIMMYLGSSRPRPRDDAPRITDIHSDPGTARVVEIGIGRPRLLVVLYPWGGTDVPAVGAVLPYYELVHPERLTDSAWRALLDSPQPPAQPPWLTGLGENVPGVRQRKPGGGG